MQSRALLSVYLVVVFLVAAGIAHHHGVPNSVSPATAGTVVRVGPVPDLMGSWQGTWSDTVYSVNGAMTLQISLSGNDYTATGTIDVSQIDPSLGTLSGSASGTLNGDLLDFTFSCTDLGNGTGSFDGGDASGSGSVTAPLNFGAFTFTGTATDTEINGTFDFTSPTGGAGIAQLSKGVPVSNDGWGEIKSLYR